MYYKEKEVIYRVGYTIFNGEEHWYTTESYGLQNAEGYISFYSNKLYGKTPNSKGYKCNLFDCIYLHYAPLCILPNDMYTVYVKNILHI